MQYIATAKNVKISPRKVRLVAEGVKDLSIAQAIAQLTLLPQRASTPVKKVLESAIANAKNKDNVGVGDLSIKEILVNEGIMYKRYHFAARGRTRPYKKRTSHIRVVLESKLESVAQSAQPVAVEEKTEVKKESSVKKLIKGRRGAKK